MTIETAWVQSIQEALRPLANDNNASAMKAYMRGQFDYFGIKAGPRREVVKPQFLKNALPTVHELQAIVNDCWRQPQREFQMVAIDLLIKQKHLISPSLLPDIERWILTKSWWDTIDMIAVNVAGALALTSPKETQPFIQKWRENENFWLRRTAILFQLKYKSKTDVELLTAVITENQFDKEFFIQKAIGWALREYSKTDAEFVRELLIQQAIDGLAKREALKWLNSRN